MTLKPPAYWNYASPTYVIHSKEVTEKTIVITMINFGGSPSEVCSPKACLARDFHEERWRKLGILWGKKDHKTAANSIDPPTADLETFT